MSDTYDEVMRAAEAETSEWAALDLRVSRLQAALDADDPRKWLNVDAPGATGPAFDIRTRSQQQFAALLKADEYERRANWCVGVGDDAGGGTFAALAAFWAARAVTL